MTRHWMTWIGFVSILIGLGAVGLAEVISQRDEKKPSLVERLSALRHTVTGETTDQETSHFTAQSGSRSASIDPSAGRTDRSNLSLQSSQVAGVSDREPDGARNIPKTSLLPSLDPLKLIPFHDSRDSRAKAMEAPHQTGTHGSAERSSNAARAAGRSRPGRPFPLGRLGESLGDLRELAKPIVEPPELAGETPIIASRRSRNPRLAEPVIIEEDPSIAEGSLVDSEPGPGTQDGPMAPTTPPISSRRQRTTERLPANHVSVATNPNERRAPLQIDIANRAQNDLDSHTTEPSGLPSSAAASSSPVSSDRLDMASRSDPAANQAPYVSARRRQNRVSDQDHFKAAGLSGSVSEPVPDPVSGGGPILFKQALPAITTQVLGPREIIIGQKATYRLTLRNDSHADAHGLQVLVKIPDSAEVIASEASIGFAQRSGAAGLEWQLQELSDTETATLNLEVIPRTSAPLEIGVALRIEPLVQQTIVTVQEPKVEIELQGPDDVLYGEAQVYRLHVSNPGTGPAQNVVLHLVPPGGGDAQQSNHVLGMLPAGKTEIFDVELVPRAAGQLQIRASATADGGLATQCVKDVFVRQASLAIEAQGLQETYAGTAAKYLFRVRNDGTADAEGVSLSVQLPNQAKLIDATEGYQDDQSNQALRWDIGAIPAGKEYTVEVDCLVQEPGDNNVVAVAQTVDRGLHVQASHRTQVIALADLKLQISDPTGPVAVGKEAVYEIRVRNRGSSSAKNVQVIALFSEGIDPVGVEGGQHTVRNGRVAFQPIQSLPPGRDVTLRIRAVASIEGTHIFRAEVLCSELDAKLSSEETTRYFVADLVPSRREVTAERPTGVSNR